MGSFTDSTKTPNLPEEGRDVLKIYIEHTRGIWVRHVPEKECVEFWFNGDFQASWSDVNIIDFGGRTGAQKAINGHAVISMLELALKLGASQRSKEIKALING